MPSHLGPQALPLVHRAKGTGSCLLLSIMCVHYEFKRTCRYRILEAQELMLQESPIKQWGLRKVTIYNAQSFS
jgi:hypothetical protein